MAANQEKPKSLKNETSSTSSSDGDSFVADMNHPLDAIVNFVKENWKEIATDLVKVGVATYFAHQLKEKMQKGG